MSGRVEVTVEDCRAAAELLREKIADPHVREIVVRVRARSDRAAALEALREALSLNISKTVVVYVE